MACSDCQKRMHLSLNEHNNNHSHKSKASAPSQVEPCSNISNNGSSSEPPPSQQQQQPTLLHPRAVYQHPVTTVDSHHGLIDYSLPITTTYLNHLRTKDQLNYQDLPYFYQEKYVSTFHLYFVVSACLVSLCLMSERQFHCQSLTLSPSLSVSLSVCVCVCVCVCVVGVYICGDGAGVFAFRTALLKKTPPPCCPKLFQVTSHFDIGP